MTLTEYILCTTLIVIIFLTGNTVNIQQPTTAPAPPVPSTPPTSSSVTLAALVEEALKKTDTSNNMAGIGGSSTAVPTTNAPASLLTPVQAPPISPSPVSTVASPSLPDTSQLASSLLEVHNLLQQQQQQARSPVPPPPVAPRPPQVAALDEDVVGVGQGLAGFSPELLAQVSSILNLPPLSGGCVAPVTSASPAGNISVGSEGIVFGNKEGGGGKWQG